MSRSERDMMMSSEANSTIAKINLPHSQAGKLSALPAMAACNFWELTQPQSIQAGLRCHTRRFRFFYEALPCAVLTDHLDKEKPIALQPLIAGVEKRAGS